MVLANRTKLANSRSLVRVFGGLNETYACSEAEYSAGVNFSARDFPALSTRKPRRKLHALTGLNGMYHLNGLLTICGKDIIYTPDNAGADTVSCTDAVSDSRKALVGIGTKILIFPDKLAFDTAVFLRWAQHGRQRVRACSLRPVMLRARPISQTAMAGRNRKSRRMGSCF